MRVILTGGSGLIGSHNAERPVDTCDTVTRLYHRSTEKRGDSSVGWQLERLAFALFDPGQQTLLQASVVDAYRGRVFGAFATVSALATLAGQAIGSVLGDRIGVIPTFTFAGIIDIAAACVAFALLGRAHRASQTTAEPAMRVEEAITPT